MSDVFLSYSHTDVGRVRPLVMALEELGWSVFWDRRIPMGKTWEQVVQTEMAAARCVLAVWTPDSVNSDWVLREVKEGRKRGILRTVVLDDAAPAFRLTQTADLVEWNGRGRPPELMRLLDAVAETLQTTPKAVAEAPQPEHESLTDWLPVSPAWLLRLAVVAAVIALAGVVGAIWFGLTRRPERPAVQAGQTVVNAKDGLTYVWIPAGKFVMGCSPGDGECRDAEKPPHEVVIGRGFWMGQTEVTQTAYQRVRKANPSRVKGEQNPVENVAWGEAKAYCDAVGLRLPTEAEWEYAARAGNTAARYGPLQTVAWFGTPAAKPVRAKQGNGWGLFDMLGNVSEWVADWYDPQYYKKAEHADPAGPATGTRRVVRGGAWSSGGNSLRVSFRFGREPLSRRTTTGFRCAGELP